jgi:hypothetical protein
VLDQFRQAIADILKGVYKMKNTHGFNNGVGVHKSIDDVTTGLDTVDPGLKEVEVCGKKKETSLIEDLRSAIDATTEILQLVESMVEYDNAYEYRNNNKQAYPLDVMSALDSFRWAWDVTNATLETLEGALTGAAMQVPDRRQLSGSC